VKSQLFIIGASGHGGVVADIASKSGYNVSFWDDDIFKRINNFNVEKRSLIVPENSYIIIGIGSNHIREKLSSVYPEDKYITLLHPSSFISDNVIIGNGSVVMSGASINNGSVIGLHCIVNTGAIVDHDCILENYVHVSPNATLCGNVSIGHGSWIGAGAVVIQGITVGKNVVIGAGAVVISNIPDNATVVRNPGKIIKTLN